MTGRDTQRPAAAPQAGEECIETASPPCSAHEVDPAYMGLCPPTPQMHARADPPHAERHATPEVPADDDTPNGG